MKLTRQILRAIISINTLTASILSILAKIKVLMAISSKLTPVSHLPFTVAH